MLKENKKNQLNDSFFDDINGHSLSISQRKVVLNNSNYLLVVAGAGSGKTLTIVGKIKYLIVKEKVNPKDILCLSFTNATVNNLKEKINYNIDCYTFHKLGLRILNEKKYPYRIIDDKLLNYIIDEYFLSDNESIIYLLDYFKLVFKKDITYDEINKKYKHVLLLLKKDIASFINKSKSYNHGYSDIKKYIYKNNKYAKIIREKNKDFLILALDIYCKYLEEINSYYGIDFSDMLSKATEIVEEYGMYHQYKYIIIDEFQDCSMLRYCLIREIINKTNAQLVCVGDDYQSIYGFSGSSISLFFNFKKYFLNAKVLYINENYRNCYQIINVSNKFICRNHLQIKKHIKTNFIIKNPIIVVYYNFSNYQDKFYLLLDYLINKGETKILILGRNNCDILLYVKNIVNDCFYYRGIKIRYLTVHKSKGLEEECVIVINMNDAFLGFPNKIMNNDVFKLIEEEKEILFAEERRLFYVALTRTKGYVYLFANSECVSPFILEIKSKILNLPL